MLPERSFEETASLSLSLVEEPFTADPDEAVPLWECLLSPRRGVVLECGFAVWNIKLLNAIN